MAYLSDAWVDPLSTEPALFVNRKDLVERGTQLFLNRLRRKEGCDAILVTGERGVGKSIFTRHLVKGVQGQMEKLLVLEFNGRGVEPSELLREIALAMYTRTGELYAGAFPPWLAHWREQLKLVANVRQLRRSDLAQIQTQAEVGLESSLIDKLGLHLTWRELRTAGVTVDATVEVTDALVHDALAHTAARLRADGVRILAFYDNLDQAVSRDQADFVGALLRRVKGVGANLSVVHLRSEVVAADVRREFNGVIDVLPLPAVELMRMVERRLAQEDEAARKQIQAVLPTFERLAAVAATPLAFLHWVRALLMVRPAPFTDLASEQCRLEVVAQASVSGVDPGLLLRFARVADRCMRGNAADPSCTRSDLLRGDSLLAGKEVGEALSEETLAALERIGLLYPKERFADPPLYRVDPVLDLLRPSVAARL